MNGLTPIAITNKLPKYGFPVTKNISSLDDSRLMATMRINGMPFESESASVIENSFLVIKGFLNQLAKNSRFKSWGLDAYS